MRILVTGAQGFIGKNLVPALNNLTTEKDRTTGQKNAVVVYQCDQDTPANLLEQYCKDCDFVYHLAGVNRPREEQEFIRGNVNSVLEITERLKKYENICPVVLASSIQAELDNPYGRSKKAGEEVLLKYGRETGAVVYIYRFSNVFGKWCRPNYNSVVATFCHNIANQLPIQISDPDTTLNLLYIDDVVFELIAALRARPNLGEDGFCTVPNGYKVTLGELAETIQTFAESRRNLEIPNMADNGFTKKLYAAYLSYLPRHQFSYPLRMNVDDRGSFTEILRTADRGQFSVNISKPGIIKGNHWHNTKNEKFLVVSGRALIQLRRIDEDEILSYHVSGEKLEVVDIPPGYTHSIINEGEADLITFMWCNECFNPERPDTWFLRVEE